jgi:hypothetical protein
MVSVVPHIHVFLLVVSQTIAIGREIMRVSLHTSINGLKVCKPLRTEPLLSVFFLLLTQLLLPPLLLSPVVFLSGKALIIGNFSRASSFLLEVLII